MATTPLDSIFPASMARARRNSFHDPLQESPWHSRRPSTASDWNGSYDRPTTSHAHMPYRAPEFADSSRRLVHPDVNGRLNESVGQHDDQIRLESPAQRGCGHAASPTRQAYLPAMAQSPPRSPGFHPGYPRPETPSSPYDHPAFPGSPLASTVILPSAAHHHSREYFSAPQPDPMLTKEASRPPHPPAGPHPDGGTTAWLQVLGAYFLFFNTWGLVNAFGAFQTYYKEEMLPKTPNSTIAWIGTLTSFFLCASPISWGPIFDVGNPRLMVLFGSFAVVFGTMMTSLCNSYYQLILAQGICCGVGGGSLFITATSVLPSYFAKKRALAMGLSASGSSLGGIIYPIIFTHVQPSIGFGWAVRIIGFISFLTLTIPCIVIKPRSKPPGRRKLFDTEILTEIPFQIMNLATFFGFVGQYIPYFFIEQFAAQHSIDLPFWMLIFLNIGSIPGRIVPSLIADRYFHPLKVLATTTGAAAVLAFSWIAIRHSTPGLLIWCLLYGFFSGAFVSLQGAAVASMTQNLRTIGTRFGINMFAGALGILIGSPVGGAIFPKSWPAAQTFCGATLFCATLAIVGTWIAWQRSLGQQGRARGLGGTLSE